jgi:phospholipid transport system substrate-binding protein
MTCRTAIRRPPAARFQPVQREVPSGAVRRRRGVRLLLGGLTVLALALAGLATARAAPTADPAQRVVDAALQDTAQVFGQASLSRAAAAAGLRALLDQYVDLPRVGRVSLGAHWRHATPEQQAAFLTVFERFLCAGYSGSVTKMGGLRFGPTAVVERDDNVTVVRTEVQMAEGPGQPVFFVVGQSDDGSYRIMDVVAAAISLSRLLSADFGAVLRGNGGQVGALIEALEHKVELTSVRQ